MAAERSRGPRLVSAWAARGRLDLALVTRNRRMTLTWVVGDIVIMATGTVGALLVLAARFDGIGRWTLPQMAFLLGFGVAAGSLRNVLLGYNIIAISRRIGRGQLDHSLLIPAPLWTTMLSEGFSPLSGLGGILPGLGLMAWAAPNLPIEPSPAWAAVVALNLLASLGVACAFSWIIGSAAFWAPVAAEEISTSAMSIGDSLKGFPLDGVAPTVRGLLVSAVPVGFVAWMPARSLAGVAPGVLTALLTPAAALVVGMVAVLVFRKGLSHYGRVGSQRYTDFGHRR